MKKNWGFGLLVLALGVFLVNCGGGAPEVESDRPPIEDRPGGGETDDGTPGDDGGEGRDPRAGEDIQDQCAVIYFDFDKYNIRGDQREALEANARILQDNPEIRILLEGHCDERGTDEYNLNLGDKRANAVRDYLTRLGIDGSRVSTISYGEERPSDFGHDEGAWAKNRRAVFVVQ